MKKWFRRVDVRNIPEWYMKELREFFESVNILSISNEVMLEGTTYQVVQCIACNTLYIYQPDNLKNELLQHCVECEYGWES